MAGGGGAVGRLLHGAVARGALEGEGLALAWQARRAGPGIDLAVEPMALSPAALGAAFATLEVQALVVLWGVTPADPGGDLAANTELALQAFEAARVARLGHVILMSSAAVYPAAGRGPWVEAAAGGAVPPAAYGRAKLAMEAGVLERHGAAAGPRPALSVLRLANVIGADMLGRAIAAARPDAPVTLDRFADGRTPRRSYLCPGTLARVLARLLAAPPEGAEVLNVADGVRPFEMGAILQAAGMPWATRPAPDAAMPEVTLDIGRLLARCPGLDREMQGDAAGLVADWRRAAAGAGMCDAGA